MRIVAGLLAILLLVVGCSDKDKVPSGIIPREKMEKILWDMVQADQYVAIYLLKDSTRINVKMETLKLYQEVFRIHQVSREDFRKSFSYYQDHPELTRNVFDSLLARGNRLRTESYSRPSLTTPKPAVTTPAAPLNPAPGTIRPVTGPGGSRPTLVSPNPAGTVPIPAATVPKPAATAPGLPAATARHLPDTVRRKQPE